MSLPVRAYRRVRVAGGECSRGEGEFIAKFRVFLRDRPGSLAGFSSFIARNGGNIGFFHYDRSVDAHRVAVEVQFRDAGGLRDFLRSLAGRTGLFSGPRTSRDDVQVIALENVLEIKVRLANKPGTLAAFARLLKKQEANVIYMLYDGDIDAETADVAVATESPDKVDALLGVLNGAGYRYRVLYRGTEEEKFGHVIGLKQVEKFFLRLRDLIGDADLEDVRSLVDSSQDLYSDLVRFYEEAGNHLEAGDVFEEVLALASMAVSRTGGRFAAVGMLPLQLSDRVRLSGFRLPTSENIYVFEHDDEITMIDAGYGLYYEDVKNLLRGNSLDPARVKRVLITHPDADHIGAAGCFEEEFGARVFMHRDGKGVIKSKNRAHGTSNRLTNLNRYFTRLVTGFTRCRYPVKPSFFSDGKSDVAGDFRAIDAVQIGDLEFRVLESMGGHIPGQVFFLNESHGLCFTSDFLINAKSLSAGERKHLRINRDLLINVNSDSALFEEEMAALQDLIGGLDADLKKRGKCALVFPGHGNYYDLKSAAWPLK